MILPGWPLLLLLQTAPTPPSSPELEKARASVLLVRGKLSADQRRMGSGVVIAPNLVATNAHVVEGNKGLTVSQGPMTWAVTAVRLDPGRDLCVLTVPGLTVHPVTMAEEPLLPGQEVVAVGFPGGHGPVATPGRLRGIWHHGEGRLLQSDALTQPGSSGGGLFDMQGRLLGLTTMTFTASPRLNFSVPVAWIQDLALAPVGEVAARVNPTFENHGADLLERLSADPRNWSTWESAARQWVLDLPGDADAWLALGLALDRSARTQEAASPEALIQVLNECVEAYRHSLSLHPNAKTFNNLGVALDLLNRFDESEQAFAEALHRDPAYATAWLNLASARFNAGRFATAAEAFQKGLRLRPDEAEAWVGLAQCQWRAGQREGAVGSLKVGLRYRPLVTNLWLDLGLWLVDLKRLEEAGEVHARLVSLNPELAARLQAYLNRAQVTATPAKAPKKRRR